MPPRRRAPVPVPIDVDELRRKLADGKIVRVGLSRSAQFPEGGTGRVRGIGDPAVDGEEFIQVEVNLNGTRDVLPFTPADLTPATRAKAAAPAPPVPKQAPPTRTGPAVTRATAPPATNPTAPAVTSPTAPAVNQGAQGMTATASSELERVAAPELFNPTSSHAAPNAGGVATPKTKAARGSKKTPAVSISIATAEGDPTHWRIEAKVGAKVVVRAGSVSGARVWELVRLLEDETLSRAVGQILDEQRKATQARADALASELARVRAELEELPGRS